MTLPSETEHVFWIAGSSSESVPAETTRSNSESIEVALPDDINGKSLFIANEFANRALKLSLIELAKKEASTVKQADFNLIYRLSVHLKPESGIVSSGMVRLVGKETSKEALVSASDQNKVSFHLFPLQDFEVNLTYDTGVSKAMTEPTSVKAAEFPASGVVEIHVPFKFDTSSSSTVASTDSPSPKGGEQARQSPASTFFNLLFGLAIVGGLAFAGYWYYKNNTKVVEGVLTQAGIKPHDSTDPPGVIPKAPEPRTVQKIELAGSDPIDVVQPAGATARVKNPRLVTPAGEIILIPEGAKSVGRESSDIEVPDSSVSRNHAQISRAGEEATITDLGSTNGTFVNGVKLTSPTVLKPGDTVQFGAMQYRYED